MKEKINYLTKSGIFGLVVADALGVPYEFESRRFCDENPMIDMIGYGTYNLPKGCKFHTRCPYALEKCKNETLFAT